MPVLQISAIRCILEIWSFSGLKSAICSRFQACCPTWNLLFHCSWNLQSAADFKCLPRLEICVPTALEICNLQQISSILPNLKSALPLFLKSVICTFSFLSWNLLRGLEICSSQSFCNHESCTESRARAWLPKKSVVATCVKNSLICRSQIRSLKSAICSVLGICSADCRSQTRNLLLEICILLKIADFKLL